MSARVEIFRAKSLRTRWRFRIIAANGQVVGQSSESYVSSHNALRGFRDLRLVVRADGLPVKVISR